MNKGSVIAINSVWLFIKSLLIAAYGEKYSDDTSMNVDLINRNIFDIKLRNALHEIRMERNSYEHENLTTCTSESIERWNSTLQECIKYVNSTTVTGYKFKLKQIDTIRTLPVEDNTINALSVKEVIVSDDKHILNDSNVETQSFIKSRQTRMTDCYYVAYGDSEKSFSITGNFNFDNQFPIFSVVHNFLTRGKTIIESEFLKSKKLSSEELETVYILEIIILRAICEGLCENGRLHISSKHKTLAKIAFGDIKYLCYLLTSMSDQKVDMPIVKFVDCENEFEAGKAKPNTSRNIVAKISEETSAFYMPKMFSSHIDYKITSLNIRHFCTVLKLLFGHDNFRDGQLASLQTIFGSKENHMIILPTGYGKSLIYQFCALIQPQVTVVVSPTDSLIYDQIVNLKTFGLTEIVQLDKNTNVKGYSYQLLSNLLYSTPDVLESENVFSLINGLHKKKLLNTIAIDEAHQVSVWGHCFDANYFTLLHQIKNEFPQTQFLLFSATASQRIKEDLEQQFKPRKLNILQPCPLVREHIQYSFKRFDSETKIFEDIKNIFEKSYETENEYDISDSLEIPRLTLVICNDFSVLSKLYNYLCKSEITIEQSLLYQGEKNKYNSFRLAHKKILLTDDTNLAGINIPFLRNVIIIGFPPSKEWFYQECGRIGRNGEKSNVVVYSSNQDFDDVIKKLPANNSTSNITENFKKTNNLDFSNLEFISSFLINDSDSNMAIQLLSEIVKCVYVRNDATLGTVIGKMGEGERAKYDRALFLLYYCGIIEKWLFSEDKTYRFYINMNIDDGAAYFIGKTINKVKLQSGNDDILSLYLSNLDNCDDFNKLFIEIANWISENGYFIRRQMFLNTLQLTFDATDMNNEDIEQNLALYFSIGHTKSDITNQKVHFDVLESFISQDDETKDFEDEDSVSLKQQDIDISIEPTPTTLIEENTVEQVSTVMLENVDTSELVAETPQTTNVPAMNTIIDQTQLETLDSVTDKTSQEDDWAEKSIEEPGDYWFNTEESPAVSATIPQSIKTFEETDQEVLDTTSNEIFESKAETKMEHSIDFAISTSRETLTSWINEISITKDLLPANLISAVKRLEECSIEEIAFVKVYIEREIEYKFNKNLLIMLSVIELVKGNNLQMNRTKIILENLNDFELETYFKLLSNKLSFSQKTKIDNILLEKGKNKVYYKGFLGFIKKLFKI